MTPEEIRSVTFEKSVRGYRCDDVDEFLQQAATGLAEANAQRDAALRENAESKQKLVILAKKIEEYRDEEDTLKTAMINAQRMGDNVIREAKQKADVMMREATVKADDIVQKAHQDKMGEEQELERLRAEVSRFKSEVLNLYKQHIELLSRVPGVEETEEPGEEPETALETEEPTEIEQPAPVEEEAQPEEEPVAEPEVPAAEPQPESEAVPQPDFTAFAQQFASETAPAGEPEDTTASFGSFRGISFDD